MSYHDRHRGDRRDRGDRACFNCGRQGHLARDCRSRKRDRRDSGRGGHYRRGRHGPRQRTQPQSGNDVELRLKSLIVRIGESSQAPLHQNLNMLAGALQGDIAEYSEFIINTMFQCVEGLARKTPIYGVLVGLLNIRSFDFGAQIVKRLHQELKTAFAEGKLLKIRMLTRFAAELVNDKVLTPSPVVQFLRQLTGISLAAVGAESECVEDLDLSASDVTAALKNIELHSSHTDHLVFTAMTALPHLLPSLDETHDPQVQSLLKGFDTYMAARPARCDILYIQPNHELEVDTLQLLHEAVQATEGNPRSWKIESILRPAEHFSDVLSKDSHQHEFAPTLLDQSSAEFFSLSALASTEHEYLPTHLTLFAADDEVASSEASPLDRCIIAQYARDTLNVFHDNEKEGCKHLLSIPVPFDYRAIVVETIISELLQLPHANFAPMYYSAVVISLFKLAAKQIAPVVGRGVNTLFVSLESIDVDCRDRLADFWCLHLSNFDHKFQWEAWQSVVQAEPTDPQRVFVENVLKQCVALSYYERVREALPESFAPLLGEHPMPAFRFLDRTEFTELGDEKMRVDGEEQSGDEAEPAAVESVDPETAKHIVQANAILKHIRANLPADELQDWIEKNVDDSDGDSQHSRLKLFLPTLLFAGCKSYSHFVVLLNRYRELVRALITTPEAQSVAVNTVAEFWQHSDAHVRVILDKLFTFQVIEVPAVVNWVFHDMKRLHTSFPWGVLHQVLNKGLRKIKATKQYIAEAAKASKAADADTEEADAENEPEQSGDADESPVKMLDRKQKDMFLVVFQRLSMCLEEHIASSSDAGVLRSRLVQLGRKYSKAVRHYLPSFQTLLFSDEEVSAFVAQPFKQLCSL